MNYQEYQEYPCSMCDQINESIQKNQQELPPGDVIIDVEETVYVNECNKAMPCTVYPQCDCKTYDYKKILCRKFPMCVDQNCIFGHEEMAHKYRTKMCKFGKECQMRNYCAYAHTENQLRTSCDAPIKGYTWLEKYQTFQRNVPLNTEVRLISQKLDKLLDIFGV